MSIAHIAITVLALAVPEPSAVQHHRAEAQYAEIWNQPITPFPQRKKIDKNRVPVLSELHKAVQDRRKTTSDDATEASVMAVLRKHGVLKPDMVHVRMTCRTDLCEYVLVYPSTMPETDRVAALRGLRSADNELCPKDKCQISAIIGGNRSTGGLSVMGYIIPGNQGFI